MSLLTICQNVAKIAGVASPSAVIGLSDETAQLLLACANRAGKSLEKRHQWLDLVTEYTFNTVASTANYELPSDYSRLVDGTLWDRSNYEQIRGPLSPQEWQLHKSSILASTATTWKQFRIRNVSGNRRFSIHPTPDAIESLVFEYVSKNWCESSGGTGQSEWLADTDVGILDEYLIELETTWRFLSRLGLAYEEEFNEAQNQVNQAIARDGGMSVLSLSRKSGFKLIGPDNVPETGFGS
jgi:hypothetical protein